MANGQKIDTLPYKFDHIVLLVNNDSLKSQLDKIFTPADKLFTVHENQGTEGSYYLFYNTYLELLSLEDLEQAKINSAAFGSEYWKRWNNDGNPFAIGVISKSDQLHESGYGWHQYINQSGSNNDFYLMAPSNKNERQLMLYATSPQRAYEQLETVTDINNKPAEIQVDLRSYLTHPSGVQRLTKIEYVTSQDIDTQVKLLEESPIIEIHKKEISKELLILKFEPQSGNEIRFSINDFSDLIIQY